MKCRIRMPILTAHVWSESNPHPAQELSEMEQAPVIRVYGGTGCSRRRYLKDGDVILPTALPTVWQVHDRDEFARCYEVIDGEHERQGSGRHADGAGDPRRAGPAAGTPTGEERSGGAGEDRAAKRTRFRAGGAS